MQIVCSNKRYTMSVDWDIFITRTAGGYAWQVQRCDAAATMTDDEAIAAARRCGVICDDDGFLPGMTDVQQNND